MRARSFALGGTLLVCLLGATPSTAARGAQGVVVRVAEGEVVIDLGRSKGVADGGTLQLFRRMTVTHPVSGKEIVDRFPIGEVTVAQAGELLSIVTQVAGLRRAPQVGDYAVAGPPPEPPAAPQAAQVVVAPTPVSPDVAALEASFQRGLGRPLTERVTLYESWLQAFPESPHADRVGREVTVLRALTAQAREAEVAVRAVREAAPPAEPLSLTVRFARPPPTRMGSSAEVAVAIAEPEYVETVRLIARRKGAGAWTTTVMERAGDYYYRGRIPGPLLEAAGQVEYLIEAVRTNAQLERLVGRTNDPVSLSVTRPPPGAQPPGQSRFELSAEMVDFNTAGEQPDHYFASEASFAYALEVGPLYRVRVGVGTLDGEGLTRQISLNYAFAEGEVALNPWSGLSMRVSGGSHHNTEDGRSRSVTGFEGGLRVGRDDGTHLTFGTAILEDLGNELGADLHVGVFEKVPVDAGVWVTNLPVDEDRGVRITGQVGYRAAPWITVAVRAGWNARTINHYGFTGGGAVTLDW